MLQQEIFQSCLSFNAWSVNIGSWQMAYNASFRIMVLFLRDSRLTTIQRGLFSPERRRCPCLSAGGGQALAAQVKSGQKGVPRETCSLPGKQTTSSRGLAPLTPSPSHSTAPPFPKIRWEPSTPLISHAIAQPLASRSVQDQPEWCSGTDHPVC